MRSVCCGPTLLLSPSLFTDLVEWEDDSTIADGPPPPARNVDASRATALAFVPGIPAPGRSSPDSSIAPGFISRTTPRFPAGLVDPRALPVRDLPALYRSNENQGGNRRSSPEKKGHSGPNSRTASVVASDRLLPRKFPSSKAAVLDRRTGERINPKTGWAQEPDLVKNRYKNTEEEAQRRQKEKDQYKGIPEPGAEFFGTGLYLWPNAETNPREIFGRTLDALDIYRRAHSVFIIWDEELHCLVVKSSSYINANKDIKAAIKGIRQAHQDAKSQAIFAIPKYIVLVPTTDAIREKVTYKSVKKGEGSYPMITGLQLSGPQLSGTDKKKWAETYETTYQEKFDDVKGHLKKSLGRLRNTKDWMRMRVHFGQVNLQKYKEDFYNDGYSFSKFCEMMTSPHVANGSIFDRNMPHNVATALTEEIHASASVFQPVSPKFLTLKDVKSKDTEILFLNTPSGYLRLEAALDRATEVESRVEVKENGKEFGDYQAGTISMFEDNRRNKRAELTTMDLERGIDWTLEIITDGEIKTIPPALQELMTNSIRGTTEIKKDRAGFHYPIVKPRLEGDDYKINHIVVRSVYEYEFKDSGYILEVAVYRRWEVVSVPQKPPSKQPKPAVEDKENPVVNCSVSLYHMEWDHHMTDIKNTEYQRQWDSDLKCFFPTPQPNPYTIPDLTKPDWLGGMQGFLQTAKYVKEMLQRAYMPSED